MLKIAIPVHKRCQHEIPVDKQGCIQPCPTSNTQGEIPAGYPQPPLQSSQQQQSLQSQQQLPDQSIQSPDQQSQQQQSPVQSDQTNQQPPQPQPPIQSKQQQLQPPQKQSQNGSLANKNNLIDFGPIGTEVKLGPFPCKGDLSGKWHANDGAVYYIKENGASISWFGSNLFNDEAINGNPNGIAYANEAKGKVYAQAGQFPCRILVHWDDIGISDNHLRGVLLLNVDPSNSKLTSTIESGGFGPSEWTRSR